GGHSFNIPELQQCQSHAKANGGFGIVEQLANAVCLGAAARLAKHLGGNLTAQRERVAKGADEHVVWLSVPEGKGGQCCLYLSNDGVIVRKREVGKQRVAC